MEEQEWSEIGKENWLTEAEMEGIEAAIARGMTFVTKGRLEDALQWAARIRQNNLWLNEAIRGEQNMIVDEENIIFVIRELNA